MEGDPETTVAVPPPTRFGRYERLEFLGEGGMARVYKAYDPTLDRVVALKFIRGDDPQLAERLLMEARAQARIEHEHVCKMYEAGQVEGRPYIAMQYVRGKTLNELAPVLTLEQKVKLMKEVAEAMHAAHRVGLIHRDLKPSNVMAEQSEDGQWIPKVMDFGLAREVQTPGMTATGMVVGSPWYMSPEQARGEVHNLDRRSDVYSLGATLYELLSGKRLFDAESTVDVLMKVALDDPVLLRQRDPAIPLDLETIVMKCVEKAPSTRYDSAKALAEDLSRYLNGEPILVRPATWFYRASKKVRKHRALVITAVSALVLILVFAGVGIRARQTARERAMLARHFGQEAKEMETLMRIAYMLPLHDVTPQRKLIEGRINTIQKQIEQLGESGYGPGHYVLGRGYLALHEYEKAKQELQKAWDSGYKEPEVAYALGLNEGALYQKMLDEIERIPIKEQRDVRIKEAQRKYRDPALQYLRQSKGVQVESPEYAEGLIALYDGRYEEALSKARRSFERVPWLYEARKLEGDVYLARGIDLFEKGDYQEASSNYETALLAFRSASDVAHSDAALYEDACKTLNRMLFLENLRGGSLEKPFAQSLIACGQALECNPQSAEALLSQSEAHWELATYLNDHGMDPIPEFRNAREMASKALAVDPTDEDANYKMAQAFLGEGQYEISRGLDPRFNLDQAIGYCRKAIDQNPNSGPTFNILGNAYLAKGSYEMSFGLDPRRDLNQAIGNYKESSPSGGGSVTYSNMGLAYQLKAVYEMKNGYNPLPSFDLAIDTFQRAQLLNQGLYMQHNNLGYTYRVRANYEFDQGSSPMPSLEKAQECLDKAISKNPNDAYAYGNRAIVFNIEGAYKLEQGEDPSSALEKARAALESTLRINQNLYGHPDFPMACAADLIAGRWAMKQGLSPDPFFRRERSLLGKALQFNPANAYASCSLGELCRRQAEWKAQRRQNPGRDIEEGLVWAGKGLALNPRMPEAWAVKGVLLLQRAQSLPAGESRDQAVHDAVNAFEKVFALNRNLQRKYQPYLNQAKLLIE